MAKEAHVDMRVAEGLLKLLTGKHTPTAKKIHKRLSYKFAREERDKLRSSAPDRSGKTRKAVKARTTRSGGAAVFVDKRRAPHFYFVEAGTKKRRTKAGANRGSVDARPWIKSWRESAKARVASEVVTPLLNEVKRAILQGMKV
jgi:hypothetical protein